mgnify:CR=1 FL=1
MSKYSMTNIVVGVITATWAFFIDHHSAAVFMGIVGGVGIGTGMVMGITDIFKMPR